MSHRMDRTGAMGGEPLERGHLTGPLPRLIGPNFDHPRSLRAISLAFHAAICRRAGSLSARLMARRRPSAGAPEHQPAASAAAKCRADGRGVRSGVEVDERGAVGVVKRVRSRCGRAK